VNDELINTIHRATIVFYTPTGNATLDAVALKYGAAMQAALYGSKPRSYVNYGQGNETLQALYGYESWRLDRLKGLKRKYDPKGQFSFFAPIPLVGGLETSSYLV